MFQERRFLLLFPKLRFLNLINVLKGFSLLTLLISILSLSVFSEFWNQFGESRVCWLFTFFTQNLFNRKTSCGLVLNLIVGSPKSISIKQFVAIWVWILTFRNETVKRIRCFFIIHHLIKLIQIEKLIVVCWSSYDSFPLTFEVLFIPVMLIISIKRIRSIISRIKSLNSLLLILIWFLPCIQSFSVLLLEARP